MPLTAAILSEREISIRALCTAPSTWIELSPTSLILLVHGQPEFRRALFAGHARRLPIFFAKLSSKNVLGFDQRLADWLLNHAQACTVRATHAEIAQDLLTAREVVSRRLRAFAVKGWIEQQRGRILITAPAALSRIAKGVFSLCSAVNRHHHEIAPADPFPGPDL
ncbi:Crp/Fnr family transcriptional regulator [Marivita sp. S0852]|uniref:Crp/Fnr family transcriptional regulator n=1 Tax=Marivita sp. S0852 TaxID=3373893 RepID=UPI00398288C4